MSEQTAPRRAARLAVVLIFALATGLLLVSGAREARASTFAPTVSVSLANSATGASSNLTATLTLGEPDAMFHSLVLFIPPEFGVTVGSSVPDGALAGTASTEVVFGLINGACNQSIPFSWDLLDASTNVADTVSFQDTDGNTVRDYAEDGNGDGLLDGVTKYPAPLTRILPGVTPRARIAGFAPVAGVPYLISLLILEPGTPLPGFTPAAALGYPAVLIIRDEGDPQRSLEPGPITDTCSPLQLQADLYGVTQNNPFTVADESGVVYRTNPSNSGVYAFSAVVVSEPDADGDGYENTLDTCSLTVNTGNPRITNSGDVDADGLDVACDPNDNPLTGGANSDQDSDGYLNRQDNCPLVANGEATTNQADIDIDGIGTACDPAPGVPDGHQHMVCLVDEVTVGAGGPAPQPSPCDIDSDGVLTGTDNCPTVSNAGGQTADVDGDLAGDACDGAGSGNVDCSPDPNGVNAVDALKVLRHAASLAVAQSEPCLDLGLARLLKAPLDWKMGDVDCGGTVTAVDALKILRAVAGLSVAKPVGCPEVKPP